MSKSVLSGALVAALLLLLDGCPNPFLKSSSLAIAPPVISPGGGEFGTDQSVSLSTIVSGATIYYTTNGSTPTTSSTRYSGPIAVAGNGTVETIKAIDSAGGSSSSVVQASFTINYSIGGSSTLVPPTFSPSSGVFTAAPAGGVALSGPTGASLYFTTNGTTPSASNGTRYTGPISVSGTNGATTTIRAISTESGFISSPVVSATYEINYGQVSTPQFSDPAGIYSSDQTNITISVPSAPAGVTILYSVTSGTVGSPPTTAYSGPFSITGDGTVDTVEAVASASGYTASTVAIATYSINYPTAAAPTFSPGAGTYTANQSVSLSDTTSGGVIYYTTDGTTPTYPPSGTTQTYTTGTTIPVSGNGTTETIQAIAKASNTKVSSVAVATYSLAYPAAAAPSFSPAGGSYSTNQSVSLSDSTTGATIYYTTDGTTPTYPPSGTTQTYTTGSTISVSGLGATETIEAIAKASNTGVSSVAVSTYLIGHPTVPAPVFTVSGGVYEAPQSITIGVPSAPPGTTIYYTATPGYSGTTPTTSSSSYSGSVPTGGAGSVETIEAIATAPGYLQSPVTSEVYIIASSSSIFTTSGTFTVPSGVSQITVKLWGAGGGSGSGNGNPGGTGGGGGFSEVTFSAAAGQTFTIGVGSGGAPGISSGSGFTAGGGGGMSYIQEGTTYLAIAGGGGGGGEGFTVPHGGAGGGGGAAGGPVSDGATGGQPGSGGAGGSGGSGSTVGNAGASISAGGAGGASVIGRSGSGGTGYGGGGSGGEGSSFDGGGGGGGGNLGEVTAPGNGPTPGDAGDPDLASGYAAGGAAGPAAGSGYAGGGGYVVIEMY